MDDELKSPAPTGKKSTNGPGFGEEKYIYGCSRLREVARDDGLEEEARKRPSSVQQVLRYRRMPKRSVADGCLDAVGRHSRGSAK